MKHGSRKQEHSSYGRTFHRREGRIGDGATRGVGDRAAWTATPIRPPARFRGVSFSLKMDPTGGATQLIPTFEEQDS